MWQQPSGDAERRPASRTLLVLLGWLLCLGGLALVCWSVYELTKIGTCASGGPYVSARPCPEGTGTKIMLVFGGVLLGLVGLACLAIGSRGRTARSRVGYGLILWSLLFLGIAGTVAFAAFGPDAEPDDDGARIAAIVLLVTFVPMALVPLIGALALGRSGRREREPDPDAVPLSAAAVARARAPAPQRAPVPPVAAVAPLAPAAGAPATAVDPVAQLERLARLKETGAIDAAEYERLKDQIIGA